MTPPARGGSTILEVKNISLAFGGVKALSDISFDVREHEVRAIIGPNGVPSPTPATPIWPSGPRCAIWCSTAWRR